MKYSDVIQLNIKPHRHVGGIRNANSELKCRNLKILMPRLFADRIY